MRATALTEDTEALYILQIQKISEESRATCLAVLASKKRILRRKQKTHHSASRLIGASLGVTVGND